MDYTGMEVIGALLEGGGSQLFGARVELSWPDGLPPGMTENDLRSIGQQWAPQDCHPQWVRADAKFCRVLVPCGKELLTDGACERHGKVQSADPADLITVHADDGTACDTTEVIYSVHSGPECGAHGRLVRYERKR